MCISSHVYVREHGGEREREGGRDGGEEGRRMEDGRMRASERERQSERDGRERLDLVTLSGEFLAVLIEGLDLSLQPTQIPPRAFSRKLVNLAPSHKRGMH